MTWQRLKGQEVEIRVISNGDILHVIKAVGSFNEQVMLEALQDGFLGEVVDRFDDILKGYGGDTEFQIHTAVWSKFQEDIVSRAQRKYPNMQFNVGVTEFYSDGSTRALTYVDVQFGQQTLSIASRSDYVKVKIEFKCSERLVTYNGVTV